MLTSGGSSPNGYRLISPIGRGATSVVWAAEQLSTRRVVALKLLDANISGPDAMRRFDRECQTMAALATHPNIVTIHDAGLHHGQPWIAMERCAQGSLSAYVAKHGPLRPAAGVAILAALARALATAHERGILHCDIKPGNIMLTDHGEPSLTDFGIARATVGRSTTTGARAFTLDYVAPELLDDARPSASSDIYSLGVTIWELLAGRPPFSEYGDVSPATVMRRILDRPLPELPHSTPAELATLLRQMTAKEPAGRIVTMSKVATHADHLKQVLAHAGYAAASDPPLPALVATYHYDVPAKPNHEDGSPTRYRELRRVSDHTATVQTSDDSVAVKAPYSLVASLLALLNLAVFAWTAVQAGNAIDTSAAPLIRTWVMSPRLVADGEWWRLITSSLLHLNLVSLMINLILLWIIGNSLEKLLGHYWFLAVFLLPALGSNATVMLASRPEDVVAGAPVLGLLAGLLVARARLRLPVGWLLGALIFLLAPSFFFAGISIAADTGGLMVGAAATFALVFAPVRNRTAVQVGALGGLAVLLLVIVAVVATTTL